MQYSVVLALAFAVLAQSAAIKPTVTITGKGAADVGGNKFGCAHIKPAGKTSQLVCTGDFTAEGFTISVKDESSKIRLSCKVKGTSGTCGPSGAGAKISKLARREPHHTEAQIAAKKAKAAADTKKGDKTTEKASGKPTVTITGTGVADVGANKLGCAHIKPAGKTAQLVCTSDITAEGFSISVKDESSKTRVSCKVKGTSGKCGPSGAGAKISALAKREPHHTEAQIAAKKAAAAAKAADKSTGKTTEKAAGKPTVTITGTGVADVGANKLGCAHIKPAGKTAQLVCTSDITAEGFSISVKDESSKTRVSCKVKGTSGKCGPSGAGAKIS